MKTQINKLESIVNSGHTVYSFDLFDTVFYRKHFSLEEVLYSSSRYLAGFLSEPLSVASLIEERKNLGQSLKLSSKLKTQEPKLWDILSALVRNHEVVNGITPGRVVSKAIAFELSLEICNLQPNEQILKLLKHLKQQGKHIICITDMYFDEEQVTSILNSMNIRYFFRDVFVSSEIGLTKQSGDLFNHVTKTLGLNPNNILHIGDNVISDIRSARNKGLDSRLVQLKRRLIPTFEKANDIRDLASELSVSFVLDLIQQCHRQKITDIFFLSRDATILGEICRTLNTSHTWVNNYFSELNIHDLDISRASTAFLEVGWEEDRLEKLITLYVKNIGINSLNAFLRYFEIPLHPSETCGDNPDYTSWSKIIRSIDTTYERRILKSAEHKNEIVIEYLRQAGAIYSGRVAFVDIGYGGTIAKRISHYLTRYPDHKSSPTRIYCFFLLSNNRLEENAKAAHPVAQMNQPGFLNRRSIPGILRGNATWLEVFYQDDTRGPLLNYCKSGNGKITSVFSDIESSELTTESAMNINLPCEISEQQVILLTSKFQSDSVIERFLNEMSNPSQQTVKKLKKHQYLTGNLDQDNHPLTRKISPSDFSPRKLKQIINNDYWLSGSMQLSGYSSFNPALSSILNTYYSSSKLITDFLSRFRHYQSKYGKLVVTFLAAKLGVIKAK